MATATTGITEYVASGKQRRRRQQRRPSGNLSSGDLLEQVRQLLARRDGRGALDRLKQVKQKYGPPSETVALLRFCACTERARALARKGLDKEAAAMRAQAARHQVSVSGATLAEEDLARYLRYLDSVTALAVYADYLKVRPPAAAAERALADMLVTGGGWDGLDGFVPDHPLRRDAVPVQDSLEAMNAGDWARASDGLRRVSRHSPFAHWRVFCKAMQCFGAGDDESLGRTLDILPADFPLAGTVAEWRRVHHGDGDGGPVPVRRALGAEGAAVKALGDELARALRHGEPARTVEPLVVKLAAALCPEDPLQARIDLAQIAALATLDSRFSPHALAGLLRRLLPAERRTGVAARIDLLFQQVLRDGWDPAPAAALLDRLDTEFQRPADRPLARGRVLETLARTGHQAVRPELLPPEMMKTLSVLIEGRPNEPRLVFADLMEASLEADPHNREGYRFLLDLLGKRGDVKPRLRATLEAMAAHFPDDVEPWLELATLDYSMNAYRRAEQALAEGRLRAPHDERILDLQGIGFLKSADQSRKNGRFELAAKDLQRAAELRRPRLESVLRVKRMLLDAVSAGRVAAEAVIPHLDGLPPAEQLRTLAVLLHDLEENRRVKNVRAEMEKVVKGLLAGKAAALDEFGADEAASLLAPLPADLDVLYNGRRIAPVLSSWWPAILRRQEGDGLLRVFDILMGCGGHMAVREEIRRRLRGSGKPRRDPVLLLYLAVIRYEAGSDRDSRRFAEALEGAPPPERQRLRASSARLAGVTEGTLREALQTFDFSLLDEPPPLGDQDPMSLADLMGEFPGAADNDTLDRLFGGPDGGRDDEQEEEPPVEELKDALRKELAGAIRDGARQMSLFEDQAGTALGALEAIIDRYDLRGVPAGVLRDVADVVRTESRIRHNLDTAAHLCAAAGLRPGMTREARAFLFPGQRGKRGR